MNGLTKDRNRIITIVIALMTPLVAIILLLLSQGLWFNTVSISCSNWNDELMYFKQIEAMVDYGHPIGYYGYCETHAVISTFGAWGPVVLLPFAAFGKIFGWTVASPIVVNILFLTIAFAIYVFFLKPSIEQQVFTSIMFIAYSIVARYAISSTPETMFLAFALIYCVGTYRTIKLDDNLKFRLVCHLIMVYITAARGYYAIFSVLMMFALLKRRKFIELALQIVSLLLSIILFFYILKNYAAPYFGATLDTSSLSDSTVIIDTLKNSFLESLSYMREALVLNTTMRGSWYLVYFVLGIVIIVALLVKRNMYYAVGLLMWVVLLVALWVLYNPQEGSRQLMDCSIIGIILILHGLGENSFSRIFKGLVIISLIYTSWFSKDEFYNRLPEKNAELVEEMNNQALSEKMLTSDNEWDNTVAWTLTCPFNELYALPSGFAINCCYDDQVIDYYDYMQSKYVAACQGGDVDIFLNSIGSEEVARYGNIIIYSIR